MSVWGDFFEVFAVAALSSSFQFGFKVYLSRISITDGLTVRGPVAHQKKALRHQLIFPHIGAVRNVRYQAQAEELIARLSGRLARQAISVACQKPKPVTLTESVQPNAMDEVMACVTFGF